MQISCPHCQTKLSVGQPKPGRYRPKCKKCGTPFRLKVTDEDPPRMLVQAEQPKEDPPAAKGARPAKSQPPASNKPASSPKSPATGAKTTASSKTLTSVDATVDGSAPAVDPRKQPVDASRLVDATLDTSSDSMRHDSPTRDQEATMDNTAVGSAAGASVSAGSDVRVSKGSTSQASRESGRGSSSSNDDAEIPERLGGYRILRLLGRGAMGSVYEAKQVSLDRLVALKTIRGRLSDNPLSLARFTREAYAAAQLTHHNVVQVYDFGEDKGKHFFSMEWVKGGPLSDVIRERGKLEPRMAAGYVLQAARGLQFAHRNGMVHRDIKPANLLLSEDGVVKVADLGLVKLPDFIEVDGDLDTSDANQSASVSDLRSGTEVTMHGTAVGTPAYMAPEQSSDAASVDHRADIYSLGCTLYYLIAGKPPFEGTNASEVMQHHAALPVPDIRKISSRVPEGILQVIESSMAKKPDDRYGSVAEMINDLEQALGISRDGDFSPTSDQADQWEAIAKTFNSQAALTRLSQPVLLGSVALAGLLLIVVPWFRFAWILLGPSLLVAGIATATLLGRSTGPSAVITSVRRWIGSWSWYDRGIGVLGAIVFLLIAVVAGLWVGSLVGIVMGFLAGAVYHFGLIAPARSKSRETMQQAERFIRDLRIQGADEDGIRQFTARYAGKRWQGLFEAMFGYQSLCDVRDQLRGDRSLSASASSVDLRDKFCAFLDAKSDENVQARDHKRLAKIEQKGLQSEGVSGEDARERAWQMAAAVMDGAQAAPSVAGQISAQAGVQDPRVAAEAKRAKMKAMLAEARSGKYAKKRDKLAPIRFALGGHMRLLAGCLLLALFATWVQTTGALDAAKQVAQDTVNSGSFDRDAVQSIVNESAETAPRIFGAVGWSIGVTGLALVLSIVFSGWRMTVLAAFAIPIMLYGPRFGIPGVGSLIAPWMISALVGLGILSIGFFWRYRNADGF